MTTATSSNLLLLVQLNASLADQLEANHLQLLSLDKDELSNMTVEGLSTKVWDLLLAIEQRMLTSWWEDPCRQAECQMRSLELEPVLYEASRPKRLWMQWPGGRSVCLGYMVDEGSFRTWWEYWQMFKDTELCLQVVINRRVS
ncbi:hypothetical protein PG993_008462 [Apiospora rasikravindrae]|uniref:Uncharacterized protein n=1 Tax=Apiospora rasikravindrae TaxID=990691 RepID=A0ABR1T0E8_9PEZI